MDLEYLIYSSPFILGLLLTLWLIKKTYQHRKDEASQYFLFLLISMSMWLVFYMLELFLRSEDLMLIAHRLKFVGIATLPVFWLCFSLVYTNKIENISNKTFALFLVFPMINLFLLSTTHIHNFFYSGLDIQLVGPFTSIIEDTEIGFYLHTLYSYSLLLIGIVLILIKALKRKDIYLKQSIMLSVGVLFPLFGNLIFISGSSPLPTNYDITPVVFSISGAAIWYAISKYKFLDIFPIARQVVFESIIDIVIVLDEEDRIVDYNKNAKNLFQKKTSLKHQSDYEGKKIDAIVEESINIVHNFADRNKFRDIIKIEFKDGEKWYDNSISAIKSKEGKRIGEVLILRDITEQKKAEKRAEFLHSLLRHDLGNKLQITMGFLELLAEEDFSDEFNEYISDSLNSIEEGVELIDNVRTLNSLESGETEIKEVDIKKTINESLERHGDLAKKLNFVLENKIDHEVEVKGGLLMKEMFSNLIENSLTHSHGSKILISMENGENFVKVVLEDDGKGIPDEKKDKITEKGVKGDNSSGSGLGMHLVREIIEKYDGKLEILDSELGGARFEIYLEKI